MLQAAWSGWTACCWRSACLVGCLSLDWLAGGWLPVPGCRPAGRASPTMSVAPQLPASSEAELQDSDDLSGSVGPGVKVLDSDDRSGTAGLEAAEAAASDHQAASVKEKMVYAVSLQYNRLLSLPSAGGGVFTKAGRPWWTPLHLPPEIRSGSNACTIVLVSSTLHRWLCATD